MNVVCLKVSYCTVFTFSCKGSILQHLLGISELPALLLWHFKAIIK